MPVYDYNCTECGNVEEDVTVTLAELDTELVTCTVCGGDTIRAIGNAGGFRLKGSGWSKDGYATTLGDKWKAEGTFEDTKKL